MTEQNIFEGFDVIEGFAPIDKAELVGKPFGITGIRFRSAERGVIFAEIELVLETGEYKEISDSSTGVRDQITKYLVGKDPNFKVSDYTDWHDVKLFVPNGLRVSVYEVKDEHGKPKQAKTYYLTTASRQRA